MGEAASWACPGCQSSAEECEAEVGRLRAELAVVARWLVELGFPYDWSSEVPAPAFLREPLAAEWARRDGENGNDAADYLETFALEQEWAQP